MSALLVAGDPLPLVEQLVTPPPAWERILEPAPVRKLDGRVWRNGPLIVIATIEPRPGDAGVWLHTSTTRRGRGGRIELPTWADLARVKTAFHEDRAVVQVIPPRRFYVNLVDALHLWERLDGDTIPPAVYEAM